MENNKYNKLVELHRGMHVCLMEAVREFNKGKTKLLNSIYTKIRQMPDYKIVSTKHNNIKVDQETHLNLFGSVIKYQDVNLFTVYMSDTTNKKLMVHVDARNLMTKEEIVEMKDIDNHIDNFLTSILSTQNKTA